MSQEPEDLAALAELERMTQAQTQPQADGDAAIPTPAEVAAMAAATGQGDVAAGPTPAEVAAMEAATGQGVAAQPPFQVPRPTLEDDAAQDDTDVAAEAALAPLAVATEADAQEDGAVAADEAPESVYLDPYALGNEIAIESVEYGFVIGRIVYRDDALIRVMPRNASDRAFAFPLVQVDGEVDFEPGLGVSDVEVIDPVLKPYTHYVDFLGVKPGDRLEFFTLEGEEARDGAVVTEVIRTDTKDAIKLSDDTTLRFRGRGPAPETSIAVIRIATTPAEQTAETVEGVEGSEEMAEPTIQRQKADILELLRSTAPTAAPPVIPIGQRGYPDEIQREELFQDLMAKIPTKQQCNPRRIRIVEREVDIAMALKNSAVRRNETGAIVEAEETVFNTLADVIRINKAPLPAFVPIVDAALRLNLDTVESNLSFKPSDVAPVTFGDIEVAAEATAESYREGRTEMSLSAYLYNLARDSGVTLNGSAQMGWAEDQDVVRTAGYEAPVQGLDINPKYYKPDTTVVSLTQLGSNTKDRSVRVLTSDHIQYHGFGQGELIAPSDPSKVSGYATLPTTAALALRPPKRSGDLPTALLYSATLQDDNLPTVARALRDLLLDEEDTGASALNSRTVPIAAAADTDLAVWLDSALKYAVHPVDSLGPRGPRLLSVLDSVGLGDVDMSPAVSQVIWAWVFESQRKWLELFKSEQQRINTLLEEKPDRTFQSVTGLDSPVWERLRGASTLGSIMEDIQRQNPVIAGAPTVITASLLREAQGDALPLVWNTLAGRPVAMDDTTAMASLTASRSYVFRRRALRDYALFKLKAEPEVNDCPHVAKLEAIRNVSDVRQRASLLGDFIREYQGSRKGDWITCIACREECICDHEIMELNALLAGPIRREELHKAMMVKFGGARYEGKILCKNCGQGLQDIEYVMGAEYTDDGDRIITHSVLTKEQMEETAMTGASEWKSAAALLDESAMRDNTPGQEPLYSILKTIAHRGNLLIPAEVEKQIIERAETYMRLRVPADYERKYEVAYQAAIKTPKPIPSFQQFVGGERVSIIMALTTIAIQIANPPIIVNAPFPNCSFSYDGWPLQGGKAVPKKDDPPSALKYMICVVASIGGAGRGAPWETLSWEPKDLNGRIATIGPVLVSTIDRIITVQPKNASMPFMNDLNTALETMRTDEGARFKAFMVSKDDRLPVGFKPEPNPPAAGRPGVERNPLPNVETALRVGANVAPLVGPIAKSLTQQAVAIVDELNEAAKKGITQLVDKTDSVCCPTLLAGAAVGALLGKEEAATLVTAGALLRRALPTVPAAGTHLWSSFTVPTPVPVEQAVEPGVRFKLFLKYCYTGPSEGDLHEFATGNACRQCGMNLGKPLDLVDFSKEGEAILASQVGDLKVEVTDARFNRLSDAVRLRKKIQPEGALTAMTWYKALETLVATVNGRDDLASTEGMKIPATALVGVLTTLAGHEANTYNEESRILIWTSMTGLMDDLRSQVIDILGAQEKDKTVKVMTAFDQMTEDPFVDGPRAVQEYWCAAPQAAGNQFGVTEINTAKWFDIGKQFNADVNALLTANANWFKGTIRPATHTVLRRLGQSLGPFLRAWQRYVRPSATNNNGPWTVSEAQTVLRCFILQSWKDALTSSSWMYRFIDTPGLQTQIAVDMKTWTRDLMLHASQQFIRYSKERVSEILQERAALERTSIVEEYNISDEDLLSAFIENSKLKIGRWARGARVQKLDADLYAEEAEQRHRMLMGTADVVQEEVGYNMDQAAAGDNE